MRPRHLLAVSLLGTASALTFASAAHANIVISIDKTTQQMSVAVDGSQRYVWPVSTGRVGFNTPSGTFRPNRMDPNHHSNEYENAPMPHSIFFDLKGHAIHGFFDTPHLGMAVSHGCVRLSPAHAATLYSLVSAEGMANTTVNIGGRIPAGGSYMARRRAPSDETVAAQPMPIQPAYGQQQYYARPAYGQSSYGQSYGQPYYGQQQQYYAQPAYAPPQYRQW